MKQYKYKVNGAQYDVTIDSIVGNIAKVEVNGIPFEVEMQGSSLVEEDLPTQVADETAAPAVAAAPAAVEAAPAAPVADAEASTGSTSADDVADEISQSLEALVGTTTDTQPKAEPRHPTNHTTTSKFANLQFGRNYDPNHR